MVGCNRAITSPGVERRLFQGGPQGVLSSTVDDEAYAPGDRQRALCLKQ